MPLPSPGDLPDPGMDLGSPALQVDSLPAELPGKPGKYQFVDNTQNNHIEIITCKLSLPDGEVAWAWPGLLLAAQDKCKFWVRLALKLCCIYQLQSEREFSKAMKLKKKKKERENNENPLLKQLDRNHIHETGDTMV